VQVNAHQGEIAEDFIKSFQVVVMNDQSMDLMLKINRVCHANNISFITTDIRGVFANIFCDFGDSFVVNDANGETPQSLMIAGISQENPGIVTVTDDHRIPFEDGEWVTFNDVQGMTELNGSKPRQIKLLGPYTFSIEDTTGYSPYKTSGYAVQVKQPQTLKFKSLEESLAAPEFLQSDWAKMERPDQLHLAFQALQVFQQKHGGQLPAPRNDEHANEIVAIVRELNDKAQNKQEQIDEKLIKLVSYGAAGEVAQLTAFIGGVTAQEVLKACSGKFSPLKQWFYFDATEMLPDVAALPVEEFQPLNSRYDGQIAVLGRTLTDKIRKLKYFLVGSGAIGCEVLKIWAMMGLGSQGQITVTDMDVIEKSNLSRQFLFRSKDVEHLKSKTAANAIKVMNPEINITAYSNRVGAETENLFNETFYQALDGVCNALDNVEARMYMDSQCIFYKKSLLESGTLGTKGNTQVIVPFVTESYASSRDPPEKGIPTCTLHHFPNAIEHTIQWARDVFEGLYRHQAESVNSYLTNPGFIESLSKQAAGAKIETLNNIKSCLVEDRPRNLEDCIVWARLKFEEFFNNNIQQLLYNFPLDMVTSTGAPFWSGPKRAPTPLKYDPNDSVHLEFVMAAANLRAQNFGIASSRDLNIFKGVSSNVMVPEFSPKKVKINTDPNADDKKDNKQEEFVDDEAETKKILSVLPPPDKVGGFKMNPVEFEKDDDTNFHMDYITACANLRAANYNIAQCDKHKAKGIAGKIIPAMVTTTAVVSGLICIELVKLIQGKPLEQYKNGFVNLALPFFGFSEPIAPQKTKIRDDWTWTLWDRFEIDQELTLQQFIDFFKTKHNLEVTMVSSGVSMIYSFFMAKDKLAERMNKNLSEVVSMVTKQPLPENKNTLTFEVCVNRIEDDEEVDVPFVKYTFRK
jgi:ubiquitin-activating enzyme E1